MPRRLPRASKTQRRINSFNLHTEFPRQVLPPSFSDEKLSNSPRPARLTASSGFTPWLTWPRPRSRSVLQLSRDRAATRQRPSDPAPRSRQPSRHQCPDLHAGTCVHSPGHPALPTVTSTRSAPAPCAQPITLQTTLIRQELLLPCEYLQCPEQSLTEGEEKVPPVKGDRGLGCDHCPARGSTGDSDSQRDRMKGPRRETGPWESMTSWWDMQMTLTSLK